ncbi:Golgin subfamily A member 4 [Heracleum sosnowskyi]|uniref:Golgin subfamily A member 4 n=1 Tax=Heracleum sosnowskyi TaxID=360622 RepID=A0AAD8LWY8_9APIA|nr:Golgin subfamily A member 4 [Heracleum sosnowskyi]
MAMAMQSGIATSKVLILVGAGLTGTVILKSGKLSDVILQLQELTKGVNESVSSPAHDGAYYAAQIRQLAQEIRELTTANPITIYTGSSSSSGSYSSYLMPAAALGAMGYCYMWWKGWSLSDVMFVTKQNMATAVASVSKQLEHVSETLASTKKHLSKKLETLDWKLDEQKEISNIIASDVGEVKSNLNQISFDIETIHQMVSGLEGQLDLLESKQDATNTGLWYLCQAAGGVKDGTNSKPSLDVGAKIIEHSSIAYEDKSPKGLSLFAENDDAMSTQKAIVTTKKIIQSDNPAKVFSTARTRIHRSYPVSLSATLDILG